MDWRGEEVICNRRVAARVKGEVYKTVVTRQLPLWLRNGSTDKETGNRAGDGRVEDVTVFFVNDSIEHIRGSVRKPEHLSQQM